MTGAWAADQRGPEPMSVATVTTSPLTAVREEIAQFYARQMHLLDDGAAEMWAQTFTEDGVFATNTGAEPAVGRAVIAAAARATVDTLAGQGVIRRHWLGMLALDIESPGVVRARSYALVFETPQAGQATLRMSTTCEDLLVQTDGDWQVKHRMVRRDDLQAPAGPTAPAASPGPPELTFAELREIMLASAGEDETVTLDGDVLDTSFTDLGYDSIALMEITANVGRACGISLADDLTGEQTLGEVLALINAARAAAG
jgi:acyl carrier protein